MELFHFVLIAVVIGSTALLVSEFLRNLRTAAGDAPARTPPERVIVPHFLRASHLPASRRAHDRRHYTRHSRSLTRAG